MAKFVNVSTVHFQITAQRGSPGALESVLAQFKNACTRLDGTGVDLVVTCEGMESIGQTIETAESVDRPGPMLEAYASFAKRNRCHVVGSVKLLDDGKVYNAQAVIGPTGSVLGDYRKTFLTMGEIEMGLCPGPGAKVTETPAGRIGGVICFDLNYNELLEQYKILKPDILAFSSMFHGGHMQKSWAYGCQSFFAAACKDSTSDILDPLGRTLATANYHTLATWARVNLDRFFMHCDRNAEKFTDIRRKYGESVVIDRTHDLGVAVLYSETSERTAAEVAGEFGLLSLDSYLAEAAESNSLQRQLNKTSFLGNRTK